MFIIKNCSRAQFVSMAPKLQVVNPQVVRQEELPQEWRAPASHAFLEMAATAHGVPVARITSTVCIEVPEHPILVRWSHFVREQAEKPGGGDVVPVVVTNLDDYQAAHGPGSHMLALQSFLQSGLPTLRFMRIGLQR